MPNVLTFDSLKKEFDTGEDVYAAMGQTDAGRYLIIFFISKPNNRALVVSARDMERKERRQYARR